MTLTRQADDKHDKHVRSISFSISLMLVSVVLLVLFVGVGIGRSERRLFPM
jgi:hypothetical protein